MDEVRQRAGPCGHHVEGDEREAAHSCRPLQPVRQAEVPRAKARVFRIQDRPRAGASVSDSAPALVSWPETEADCERGSTMRVQLLGTGNPVPSLKRASSGYLIRKGRDVILFDHGPGAHWRLLQAGVRAVEVTHVFMSHLHYDHCVDFVRLYLNRWDQGTGKIPPLRMYGPPGFQRLRQSPVRPRRGLRPGPHRPHPSPREPRGLPRARRDGPAAAVPGPKSPSSREATWWKATVGG